MCLWKSLPEFNGDEVVGQEKYLLERLLLQVYSAKDNIPSI